MFLERALRDSWAFYSLNFVAFELIILPVIFPAKLLQFQLEQMFALADHPFLHYLSHAGISLVAYSVTATALVLYVFAVIRRQPVSIPQLWGLGLQRLAAMAMLLIVAGAAVGLGMLLFVVPGIFLLSKFAFAVFELAINRVSPMQALRNSWHSTRRAFWMLVGGFMITLFVITALQWGVEYVLTVLGWKLWWLDAFVSSIYVVVWAYFLVLAFYFFAIASINAGAPTHTPGRLEAPAGDRFGELDIVSARRDLMNEDYRVAAGTIGAVVSVYQSASRLPLYEVEFVKGDVIVGILTVRGYDLELIEAWEEDRVDDRGLQAPA